MLSAQFSKVLNDVWSNKTRSILITLSIIVGLTAVGTVLNARAQLSQSIALAYRAVNYSHGLVVTVQPFGRDFVRSFYHVPGVKAVDARRMLATQAINAHNQRRKISIFTTVDYQDMRVNLIIPLSGAWPPPKRQVLIDTGALEWLGARVGDTIQVELPSGNLRSLTIAGTVSDRSQPPALMAGTAYGYVEAETMEWLEQPPGFNQLYFTTGEGKPTKAEIQQVLERVVAKTEKAGYTVASSQAVAEVPIDSLIQILMYILTAIGGLSLFLSFFLIINTISAMVIQQTCQIGVMKAIGARAGQILWMYLLVVIFYGTFALAAALPMSIIGGKLLSEYMCGMFNITVVGSPGQLSSIVLQAVIALLGPALASLLPLSNGLHISATRALSGEGNDQERYGSSPIDRILSGSNLWFARYILQRPVMLAIRNMFRRKMRLGLTLTTLALAGAVFISIFNLRATILGSLDQMTQMQTYDLVVNFHQPYRVDKLRHTFGEISGVQAVDTWLIASARRVRPDGSKSDPITVAGVRLDSTVISAPKILEGRWLGPGDANALVITSAMLKNEPDLKVGQEIILYINNRNVTFRIVGSALAMEMGPGNQTVYATHPFMAARVPNAASAGSVLVKLVPGTMTTDASLITRLDTQLKKLGFRVASIQTSTEQKTNMQNNFTSVLIVLVLMALLLATVGGMGLMGTMSINVLERRREIGVLRAIGASNRGVTSVFMIEGVGIGIGSCLFAIPLSYPITNLAAAAIGTMAAGTPWTSAYTTSGIFAWLVIVIVLSLLANYVPARNASRLTVREVLAYE